MKEKLQLLHTSVFSIVLISMIVILAFFLRIYHVSTLPNGLYQDETAIGYNAFSILKTGMDEHHKFFPLYFKSFGDYKLPIYIYLSSISIYFFGLTAFAVRFPSILFGTIAVFAIFLFVSQLTQKRIMALLAAFLLAINPWHMHFSRAAFEVNVAVTFLLLGIVFFLFAVKKNHVLFFVSIFLFAISLYTYNVTRLLAPLTLVYLFIFYRKELAKIPIRKLIIIGMWGLLLVSPFLLTLLASGGVGSTREGLLLSSESQAHMLQERSYFVQFPYIFQAVFFSKYTQLLFLYIQNIIGIFSTNFFFITGSPHGNHSIGLGMFYPFEFFTILCGILFMYKREKMASFLYGLLTLMILILALSKEVPHGTRGFSLVIPLTIFSAIGCFYIMQYIRMINYSLIKIAVTVFVSIIVIITVTHYFLVYLFVFPKTYAKAWNSEDQKIVGYLKTYEDQADTIIIDVDSRLPYTSILFYEQYLPKKFQKSVVYQADNKLGYIGVNMFGKYEYKKITHNDLADLDHTIIITNKDLGNEYKVKEFMYPTLPVVFAADGEIHEGEQTETAYRVYSAINFRTTMKIPK